MNFTDPTTAKIVQVSLDLVVAHDRLQTTRR